MASISDELREFIDEGDLYPMYIAELRRIADRIDAELVELPKDRDGVPIHVGDTVYLDDGRKGEVTRIGIGMDDDSIYTIVYGYDFSLTPGHITHERRDSFERIADELDAWCDRVDVDGDACDKPRDLAERIRKLAKEREHE